jgi:rhamnosyltransferase
LLGVAYGETYPAKLIISPLLAVVDGQDRARQADRLLDLRARRMFDLMKDNIRLQLRTQEAALQRTCSPSNGHAVAASTKRLAPVGEPRLLFQGEPRSLANESGGRLISIILPVKNGAAKLRELLPRFLAQRSRDQIEIVAVDSASTDDSVDTLRQAGATVVAIDPQYFNHGLTRNLATKYARGSVFVFLNQSTLPADELWLANLVAPFDKEPSLAGVCGRVLPRHDADLLTHKDINQNENAKPERSVRAITNLAEYQALSHDALRQFVNFHTLSAAIRADVFRRLPFRETNFAEDLMWGKDALEAGYKIAYEPSSVALHSHNYSFLEIFRRNFDDGLALRKIVHWRSDEGDILPAIVAMVRDDHRYLEQECRLDAGELEQWRLVSVLRRTAQMMGHWIGANHDPTKGDLTPLLSITERIKAGAKTEAADGWRL